MIKLTRDRKPSAIHSNFSGKNRIRWNLELLKSQRDIKKGSKKDHDFSKKSGRWKVTKDQLLIESKNKCAYCDTPTKVISFGDVEHFRPKSKYWWLAYCYENYLPSCTSCNQLFKSDNFPILSSKMKSPSVTSKTPDAQLEKLAPLINPDPLDEIKGMKWKEFAKRHKSEKAFLINPYYEDPETLIGYIADDNIKEVELLVLEGVKNRDRIQDALDNFYGLNRLVLKQFRWQIYYSYMVHKETLQDPGISTATKKLNEDAINYMKSDEHAYAGMIRFFDK